MSKPSALDSVILTFGMGGVVIALLLSLVIIAAWVYGVCLAFSASIILGVIVLIVQPSATVLGLVGFFNPAVCVELARWMHLT